MRAGDVAFGGANPVLRRQHLEIGIGDADQRGQRHHVAIEPGGDGDFLRRLRGVAVLAPEIELVAGAERGLVVDDFAAAIGQAAGAGTGGAGIGLLTGAAEARQQRRARDARLRVRLDEARGGRRDVQIDGLGLLHQRGQFRRTEAAPPVQRRRRVGTGQSRGLVPLPGMSSAGSGRSLVRMQPAELADHAERGQPSRDAIPAGDGRKQAVRGDVGALFHVRPPPGATPGIRRRERHPTDSLMTLDGDGLRHGHGCDASSGNPIAILAGRCRGGQSCCALDPGAVAGREPPRADRNRPVLLIP